MGLARLFWAVYLGVFFLLLALQIARLLFARDGLAFKFNRFITGIGLNFIWPLAILAPEPRRHFHDLFQFVQGKRSADIIDIKAKEYKDE
jgi:hypothetical protein